MTHLYLATFTLRTHNGLDGWFENDTFRLVYADSIEEARQKVKGRYNLPNIYIQDLEITEPFY